MISDGPTTSELPRMTLLPVLPDPSTLWSSSGPSSATLLQEARNHIAQIKALKEHCQSGQIKYSLPPPAVGSLPPLPSVPVPVTSHHHTPSLPDTRIILPQSTPSIPSSSKLKSTTESGVRNCLDAFVKENPSWICEERYQGNAICCEGDGMTVWALLSVSVPEGGRRVDSIKVYPGDKGKRRERPDLSSPGWHIQLSDHLTSLNLSLPDLLYRLPHLPDLVKQPCYRCSKYLKIPDGMPYGHTGFLPLTKPASTNDEKTESAGSTGRWVCWHDSCSQ